MSRNELLKQNYHFCTVRETVKCAPTQLIIHPSLQIIFSSTHWSLWWIGCVQLRRGRSSSTRETRRANWWPDRADPSHGTAIKSFRKAEDQKSKLPHKLWGKKSWQPCNVTYHWAQCACNCLFDSRNCLLTSLILGSYYKLNWPKRASAVYWLLLITPDYQRLIMRPNWFQTESEAFFKTESETIK